VTALFKVTVTVSPVFRLEDAKLETVSTLEEMAQEGDEAIFEPDPEQDAEAASLTVIVLGKVIATVAEVVRALLITKLKVIEADVEPAAVGVLETGTEDRVPAEAL